MLFVVPNRFAERTGRVHQNLQTTYVLENNLGLDKGQIVARHSDTGSEFFNEQFASPLGDEKKLCLCHIN